MEKDKVWGFDLNEYTAEEICNKIGISEFKNDQLVHGLQEAIDEFKLAIRYQDYARFSRARFAYAPNAFEVYKRFYRDSSEKYKNLPWDQDPTDMRFWTKHVNIMDLVDQLMNDGIYEQMLIQHRLEEVKYASA